MFQLLGTVARAICIFSQIICLHRLLLLLACRFLSVFRSLFVSQTPNLVRRGDRDIRATEFGMNGGHARNVDWIAARAQKAERKRYGKPRHQESRKKNKNKNKYTKMTRNIVVSSMKTCGQQNIAVFKQSPKYVCRLGTHTQTHTANRSPANACISYKKRT